MPFIANDAVQNFRIEAKQFARNGEFWFNGRVGMFPEFNMMEEPFRSFRVLEKSSTCNELSGYLFGNEIGLSGVYPLIKARSGRDLHCYFQLI